MDKQEIIKELEKIWKWGLDRKPKYYNELLLKICNLLVDAEVKASFDIKRGE